MQVLQFDLSVDFNGVVEKVNATDVELVRSGPYIMEPRKPKPVKR